jgi:hypothetical protein
MENKRQWLRDIDERVEEKRKNYTGPFCCLTMDATLANGESLLSYDSQMREYFVRGGRCYKDGKDYGGFTLIHCPFCGTKLPQDLRSEWFDELSKILGFKVDLSIDKRKIPKEFRSDAWWKKREL